MIARFLRCEMEMPATGSELPLIDIFEVPLVCFPSHNAFLLCECPHGTGFQSLALSRSERCLSVLTKGVNVDASDRPCAKSTDKRRPSSR